MVLPEVHSILSIVKKEGEHAFTVRGGVLKRFEYLWLFVLLYFITISLEKAQSYLYEFVYFLYFLLGGGVVLYGFFWGEDQNGKVQTS